MGTIGAVECTRLRICTWAGIRTGSEVCSGSGVCSTSNVCTLDEGAYTVGIGLHTVCCCQGP